MINKSDQVVVRKASDTVLNLVEKGPTSDHYAAYDWHRRSKPTRS